MKETDLLAWIDIETTGLDPLADELLEVACIITTQDLVVIDKTSWVIKLGEEAWLKAVETMPTVVLEMHTRSGLIHEARKSSSTPLHYWVDDFDEFLRMIIEAYPQYDKFVMAGSGVARFDYTWFQLNFKKIMSHFQYYCFDVGILRRALVMSGTIVPLENKDLAHRAMTDIEDHLEEWKYYKSILPYKHKEAWIPNGWRTDSDLDSTNG